MVVMVDPKDEIEVGEPLQADDPRLAKIDGHGQLVREPAREAHVVDHTRAGALQRGQLALRLVSNAIAALEAGAEGDTAEDAIDILDGAYGGAVGRESELLSATIVFMRSVAEAVRCKDDYPVSFALDLFSGTYPAQAALLRADHAECTKRGEAGLVERAIAHWPEPTKPGDWPVVRAAILTFDPDPPKELARLWRRHRGPFFGEK